MPRRSIPKPLYPPDLATPFTPTEPTSHVNLTAEYTAARVKDWKLQKERLKQLAEFHRATREDGSIDYYLLAVELAFAHVPGLHADYGQGRGRPSKKEQHVRLYVEVLKVLYSNRSQSVANACHKLARDSDSWGNASTIETRFHETKQWLLDSTPADDQLFEPRFGYPVNGPFVPGVRRQLYDFRVEYAKMPPLFP